MTVLVADLADARPLRILGAEVLELESVLASQGRGRQPHALAIASGVLERDTRTHRGLVKALDDGGMEIVVWGESWPTPPEHRTEPVVHRLSVAAQAFKAQALAAAGLPPAAGDVEVFRTGLSAFPPVGADLSPVG